VIVIAARLQRLFDSPGLKAVEISIYLFLAGTWCDLASARPSHYGRYYRLPLAISCAFLATFLPRSTPCSSLSDNVNCLQSDDMPDSLCCAVTVL